jgi:hypothetical protein
MSAGIAGKALVEGFEVWPLLLFLLFLLLQAGTPAELRAFPPCCCLN